MNKDATYITIPVRVSALKMKTCTNVIITVGLLLAIIQGFYCSAVRLFMCDAKNTLLVLT